jgi:hypothetical protein
VEQTIRPDLHAAGTNPPKRDSGLMLDFLDNKGHKFSSRTRRLSVAEKSFPALPLAKGELEGVESPGNPAIRNLPQPVLLKEGSFHSRNERKIPNLCKMEFASQLSGVSSRLT